MKKKISNFKENIVSRFELKQIIGGTGSCSGKPESTCGGSCTGSGGEPGTCGWTEVPTRTECTCGYVSGGNQ